MSFQKQYFFLLLPDTKIVNSDYQYIKINSNNIESIKMFFHKKVIKSIKILQNISLKQKYHFNHIE